LPVAIGAEVRDQLVIDNRAHRDRLVVPANRDDPHNSAAPRADLLGIPSHAHILRLQGDPDMPKLTHPESKTTVETDNPEPYLSQGWVEVGAKKPTATDEK
jgi:hypothetical protein